MKKARNNPSPYSPAYLLEELGIEEPEDIDVEAIAQFCRATVVYEPLTGCEARIVGYGDRAIITVNTRSHPYRQRFSAGHELGHWIRDRGRIAFACTEQMFASEWSEDNPERRANRYAADLLLPERMFKSDARNREMTFGSVKKLSEKYRTSLTATAIRLVEFGSFPAMIVCSRLGQRWKWFFVGPDVPNSLWPTDQPGVYTVAYDLLRGGQGVEKPLEVSASGWIDQAGSERYVLVEDSIAIGDNMVLSLLWWKDEQQLLDLEDQ